MGGDKKMPYCLGKVTRGDKTHPRPLSVNRLVQGDFKEFMGMVRHDDGRDVEV